MYSRIITRFHPLIKCKTQYPSKIVGRTFRGKRADTNQPPDPQPEPTTTPFPQSFQDLQRLSYQTTNPYSSPAPPLSVSTGSPYSTRIQKKTKKRDAELGVKKRDKSNRLQRVFVPASELLKTGHEICDIRKPIFVPAPEENSGLILKDSRPKLMFGIVEENKHSWIQRLVTNLHSVSYPGQLKMKYKKNFKYLSFLNNTLKHLRTDGVMKNSMLPCKLSSVRAAPVTEEYRNKDEFSISFGLDGAKTVGFFIGSFQETKKPFCVPPTEIRTIKKEHKEVAKAFEQYLREESPLEPCLSYSQGGHWRNLVLRSNLAGEVMAMAVLYPEGLTQDQLQEEKQRLRTFFAEGPGSHLGLKSLYFQAKTCSNSTFSQCPAELLLGDPNLVETVAGLLAVVTPQTYLPGNTAAVENLYDSLAELALVTTNTTVIDLGCQSGILSMFLAKRAEKVIGIDSNPSLVEEARANASINNIKNVEFLHGDLHNLLPYILDDTYSEDIVVVVHPLNCGMPKGTMSHIRKKKNVARLVYVSSKPESGIHPNLFELCGPPDSRCQASKHFVPTEAVQVDVLPHTYNCDLLIRFERAQSRSAKALSFHRRKQ